MQAANSFSLTLLIPHQTASLQAAAEALAQQRFLNITDNSTRRSAMHRWAMYTNYCKSVDCPPYPVSGALVGLAIYHLAEGNAEGGKAYDTHVSAINGGSFISLSIEISGCNLWFLGWSHLWWLNQGNHSVMTSGRNARTSLTPLFPFAPLPLHPFLSTKSTQSDLQDLCRST